MYQSYFNLSEAPFSIAPDPRYLYMSQRHQEALAHLLYGVNGGGGFVLLTGEVGAGKTTVCRCLLEQIPESCDVAYIFNPKLTVAELLSTICAEFGIACPSGNTSIKVFVDCINAYLLDAHARGRHTVLIIDEAQNLSAEVLEQMRLLTNLETNQRKLLQIILLGQPELATMLAQPELRQLAQRIIARYHLGPLTKQEVAAYVRHRLEVSGTQRQLFPAALMGKLYRLSGGIPRIVNVLCDRSLLGAYVQGKERVDHATLAQAAREVLHQPTSQRRIMMRPLLAGLALLAGVALAATLYQPTEKPAGQTKAANQAEAVNAKDKIESAKQVTALPVTLEWPAAEPLSRSKALAYAALFRAWGTDYQGEDACRQAEGMGLRCRTTRGGLDELRQLDRPAVLHLRDNQGQEFHAALTQLDDKSATFTIGTATRTVAIDALAAQWSGHYTLLWRLPPVARKNIRQGERGPDVEWLGKQLAQVQGKAAETTADPVFDEAMVSQVKQFQLIQGLTPDGAVGSQTLMRLSGVADRTAPKLSHAPVEIGK
ncbi:peptidoglycan-binding protein [Sulfuricella sp. T08]|uniref:AAA family ATPase n=1 Tax=Sulfuricella sp. T08 TaxID=1632857 RepID=UPI0006179C88|nr:AAA family ATPase [Sulfuricella sp. T08]GAO35335.1 peptidoglycan-binding protein [Sulfuricella sp. T08]